MVYDDVLREVFRNNTGIFLNNMKYLETLKKAHIFRITEDVMTNVDRNEPLANTYLKDIVRNERILTPFKNVWFELPNRRTCFIGEDGKIEKENGIEKVTIQSYGAHLYEFDDGIYAVQRYQFTNGTMVLYTVIFAIIQDNSNTERISIVQLDGIMTKDTCEYSDKSQFKNIVDLTRNQKERRILEIFDNFIEKKFKNVMAQNILDKVFCHGPAIDDTKVCSMGCIENRKINRSIIEMVLGILGFINTPYYRIVFQANNKARESIANGKKVTGVYGLDRPHYILINHEKTVDLFEKSREYEQGEYKVRGHDRRKHKRMVTGRHGKDGVWIPYKEMVQWVRETWVGPKEFTVGDTMYKIIDNSVKHPNLRHK